MSTDKHDKTLYRFRQYLTLVARLQAAGRNAGKLDLSGVVQQSLLEAHLAIEQLSPLGEERQTAWLRQTFANNLRDEIRRLSAKKRDIRIEQSLDASIDQSIGRLGALLPAGDSSPSLKAQKNEQLLRLAEALNQLPETQRQAVELHHLLGLTLGEVADRLESSKPAVAGLLHRGLKKLRELMDAANADSTSESASTG
jgi:RNA polymerase sigma-70 factor (ECF subfamily)